MRVALATSLGIVTLCIVVQPASADYLWQTYDGHSYAVSQTYGYWATVEAEAESLGGHLVTINDANEQAWLFETFGGVYEHGHQGDPWWNAFWIGYCDKGGGAWGWASGDPVTYTNLSPGWDTASLIDSGTHAYMEGTYLPDYPGTWQHYGWVENRVMYGVIELDHTVPEASSLVSFAGLVAMGLVAAWRRRKRVA